MRKGSEVGSVRSYMKLIALVILFLSAISMPAQERPNRPSKDDYKAQKNADREKAKKKREQDKAQKKLKKQHLDIQDKAVKKRMKKNQRRTNRKNAKKQEVMMGRWRKKR